MGETVDGALIGYFGTVGGVKRATNCFKSLKLYLNAQ